MGEPQKAVTHMASLSTQIYFYFSMNKSTTYIWNATPSDGLLYIYKTRFPYGKQIEQLQAYYKSRVKKYGRIFDDFFADIYKSISPSLLNILQASQELHGWREDYVNGQGEEEENLRAFVRNCRHATSFSFTVERYGSLGTITRVSLQYTEKAGDRTLLYKGGAGTQVDAISTFFDLHETLRDIIGDVPDTISEGEAYFFACRKAIEDYFTTLTDGRKRRDSLSGIKSFARLVSPIAQKLYSYREDLNPFCSPEHKVWVAGEIIEMFGLKSIGVVDNTFANYLNVRR